MVRSGFERAGAFSGVAFAVLLLVAGFLPGTPPALDDPTDRFVRYYADHAKAVKASSFLMGLAALLLLWWMANLWAVLRAEEAGERVAFLAAAGGIAFAGAILGAAAINATAAVQHARVDPNVTETLYTLQVFFGNGGMFGAAALTGAVGGAAFRSARFPRWLGWASCGLSTLWVVAGLGIAYTRDVVMYLGFAAFLLTVVWTIVVSLRLAAPVRAATDG